MVMFCESSVKPKYSSVKLDSRTDFCGVNCNPQILEQINGSSHYLCTLLFCSALKGRYHRCNWGMHGFVYASGKELASVTSWMQEELKPGHFGRPVFWKTCFPWTKHKYFIQGRLIGTTIRGIFEIYGCHVTMRLNELQYRLQGVQFKMMLLDTFIQTM